MSEMQLVADRVVVIGRGRLVADLSVSEMLRGLGGPTVRVRTPEVDQLADALARRASDVRRTGPEEMEVEGLAAADVGDAARGLGLALHHLSDVEQSLEHAYLALTADDVEYHGTPGHPATRTGAPA